MKKQKSLTLLILFMCLLTLVACQKEQTILEYFDGDKLRTTSGIAMNYYYRPDNGIDGVIAWSMLEDLGYEVTAEEVGLAYITFNATIDGNPSAVKVYYSTSDGSHTQFAEETATYNRILINGQESTKDVYIKIMNEAARNYWNEKSDELNVQISESADMIQQENSDNNSSTGEQFEDSSHIADDIIDEQERKQPIARQITMSNGYTVFALEIMESGENLLFSDERFDITDLLLVEASERSLGGYDLTLNGRLKNHSGKAWQSVSLTFCVLDANDSLLSELDAGYVSVKHIGIDNWIEDDEMLEFTVEMIADQHTYENMVSVGLTGLISFGY